MGRSQCVEDFGHDGPFGAYFMALLLLFKLAAKTVGQKYHGENGVQTQMKMPLIILRAHTRLVHNNILSNNIVNVNMTDSN